jgi:predicted dehydrogenase
MIRNVKIIGAGSIGNHLAQASRRAGWNVSVVDSNPNALIRMRNEIYPTRYGAWDKSIRLYEAGKEPQGGFDVIMIGTPPHVRMPLAAAALAEKPAVLLLEKPLLPPTLEGLTQFSSAYDDSKTAVLVGYDHAVSESIAHVSSIIRSGILGKIETIDVEFREHWGGIFKAHPWLSGPADSYLGFTEKGGGASGEHSHALHLWLHLSKVASFGKSREVSVMYDWRDEGKARYDAIASFAILTDTDRVGRVVQDVVTAPTRKWARVQGVDGYIEWHCNGRPEGDLVVWKTKDSQHEHEQVFAKKRPDDFFREILHIEDILTGHVGRADSPLSLASGLAVMSILRAAYKAGGKGTVRPSLL